MSSFHPYTILESTLHTIEKQYEILAGEPNHDTIHKFRLEVKKLDALIELLQRSGLKPKPDILLKPLKIIFQQLGDIRNTQQIINLAEKHQLEQQSHAIELSHSLHRLKLDLQEHYPVLIRQALRQLQEKRSEFRSIKRQTIETVYLHQFSKVIRYFMQEDPTLELHRYRKKIKFLIYNQVYLRKTTRSAIEPEIKYLDTIQRSIGDWHDYTVLETWIESNYPATNGEKAEIRQQTRQHLLTVKEQALLLNLHMQESFREAGKS